MQARFLLGPAGSGKTFRCLAEIRAALADDPAGPPLILLAPKQATFQLERQLLAAPGLAGFSRLHIFSFDRLAEFILEARRRAVPKLLSPEGRLMVLRALLRQHEGELLRFGGSARRAGFAQELGGLLAELQEHRLGPSRLRELAAQETLRRELRDKLHDLALLTEKYADWLGENKLQDANHLLDFATETLRETPGATGFRFAGLWLDGFAEMTPQELALLAAVIPHTDRATLAFCLETEPTPPETWLSIWWSIGKTFRRCRDQLAQIPGVTVKVDTLKRLSEKNRFTEDSPLAELESRWSLPAFESDHAPGKALRVVACAQPEAEAVLAAREILQFVRAGNRYRDCAVLVRSLEDYHQPIARVFRRYGIPFFLDRRESVAHHPLAELTRNALRTVAFDWANDDWFGALKAGFTPASETEIDRLENAALEFGWRGQQWREPLPDEFCERLRAAIYPPFGKFFSALAENQFSPTGQQLAEALRELWSDLKAEATLDGWRADVEKISTREHSAPIHTTVWAQMNSWLDNVELGFPHVPLPLTDWLPILEAGLASLTVGVIPPALDEVLVGAVDRARNPSLKFALVLGANESVFPAAPATPAILTDTDRDQLELANVALGGNRFDQISRERYLSYIACTRANERLVLTFARQDADGRALNPSSLIAQLRRIFPQLSAEEFHGLTDITTAQHPHELIAEIIRPTGTPHAAWREIRSVKMLAQQLSALREPSSTENLSAEKAVKLYGPALRSSVSRMEEFAACPFKFFVKSGLRANERKLFELDARERGNFQHDVLKIFHEEVLAAGQRWRDLTPDAARERIARIAAAQMATHRHGLLRHSAATRFAAETMAEALQEFIATMVSWLRGQYEFDPVAAEFGFGGTQDAVPAWKISLSAGRELALQGRIDRVDFWRDPASDAILAVVTDYKSGGKKLELLLVEHGIQLQLLAYLGALRTWRAEEVAVGNSGKIVPAGAFYVSLRGEFKSSNTRSEVLSTSEKKAPAYRHHGRFIAEELRKFDRRNVGEGDQFKYKLNQKDGLPSKTSEAIPREEFNALLDQVEAQLRALGERIFSGVATVDPYRKGQFTPCGQCDYRAACRLDEWTHSWRELRSDKAEPASKENL